MLRPFFTVAIVCVLASACADKGSSAGTSAGDKPDTAAARQPGEQPSQGTPASNGTAARGSTAPAPSATRPSTATPAPSEPDAGESPTSPARAETAATADVPRAPEFREVTIPAGKRISVTLTTPVASDTSKVEDPVRGTLAQAIAVSGTTVVPAGSEVTGSVIEAKESGRVKGRASVVFQFERLVVRNASHDIRTARITRVAASSERDDLKKGGIGAGVGAIVGGIIGGGKGALIGAGAGGAGTVLATKGKEVRLPAGTTVTTTLQDALTVTVPRTAR